MSLQACHECGKDVSSEAAACPHCGAKVKAIKASKEKKPTSKRTYWLLGLLAIVTIGTFAMVPKSAPLSPAQLAAQQAAIAQQQAAEAKEQEAKNARFNVALAAARAIRHAVRDPDSLKFDSLRVNKDATVVCSQYRARNGFGGMNREFIVFHNQTSSQSIKAWNKFCTQPMEDDLGAA